MQKYFVIATLLKFLLLKLFPVIFYFLKQVIWFLLMLEFLITRSSQ